MSVLKGLGASCGLAESQRLPAYHALFLAIPASLRLSAALLVAGFGFALFYHGTDQLQLAAAFACVAGMAGLCVRAILKAGVLRLPASGTALWLVLYAAYLVLILPLSSVPYISTLFTLIFSVTPLLCAAIILSPQAGLSVRVHGAAMAGTLGLCAFWALVQYVFFYHTLGTRIHHPMLDPNNLAALFNLAVIPAFGLYLLASGRRRVIQAACLFAFFYAAMLVTQSRGGMLALLAGLGVLAVFMPRPAQASLRTRAGVIRWLAAGGLLLAIPLLLQLLALVLHKHNMLSNPISGGVMVSLVDRASLWTASLNMARDHFWTGTGLGSFSYVYPRYRLPADQSDGYFAHMDLLQFWAEGGIFLPVIFVGFLSAVLWRTIRAMKAARGWDAQEAFFGLASHGAVGGVLSVRAEIIIVFAALFSMILHTQISFHLYTLPTLFPVGVLLAWWYDATSRALALTGERPGGVAPAGRDTAQNRVIALSAQTTRRVFLAVALVVLCVPLLWTARSALGIVQIRMAQAALAREDYDRGLRLLARAHILAPHSHFAPPQLQARFARLQLQGVTHDGAEDPEAIYQGGLAAIDRALALNRYFAHLQYEKGLLMVAAVEAGLGGEALRQAALTELEQALKNNPMLLDARFTLARLYNGAGEFSKALYVMEGGLGWPRLAGQTDINFLVTTARYRLRQGDRAGYQLLINEAALRAQRYKLTRPRSEIMSRPYGP